jgi:hypothetical protein
MESICCVYRNKILSFKSAAMRCVPRLPGNEIPWRILNAVTYERPETLDFFSDADVRINHVMKAYRVRGNEAPKPSKSR